MFEVVAEGFDAIRAVAAYRAVGGAGDVLRSGFEGGDEIAEAVVDRLRRITFVAATEESERGVVADAEEVILRVGEEEIVVVGVGAVPGIGEPEVLPDHNTIVIGGVIEGFVAGLADPVADHVEVLVAVVTHSGFVFASTIAEHGLGKAPIASVSDESAAVDRYLEYAAVFGVSELATPVWNEVVSEIFAGDEEGDGNWIEVGFAVADWPPQLWICYCSAGWVWGASSTVLVAEGSSVTWVSTVIEPKFARRVPETGCDS